MMTTKRWIQRSILSAAVLLLAFTTGCGKAADKPAAGGASAPAAAPTAAAPVKIKFGLDTAATGSPQFRVAKEKGYLQKNGIDAEFSDFPYGIDTINAMLVNRTDAGSAADYALLNSLGKGDIVIAGTISRANDKSAARSVLIVRDSIKSEQDLAGKRLGVARATAFEYTWAKYLEKLNIPQSKVKFVNYSSLDEVVIAMQKNEMDAVWASGVLLEKLKGVPGLKQLVDSSATGVYTKAFVIFQRSYAEKNPDAVANTLKSLDESTKFIAANPTETADIQFNTIKLPKEGVLKDLEASNYVVGFTQEDYDHLNQMHGWLIAQGLLKDKYDLKSKINVEPLKKALPSSVTYKP